jgi:hypothetical protein
VIYKTIQASISGIVKDDGGCKQVAKRAGFEDAYFHDFHDFLDIFRMDVQLEYDVTRVMKAEGPV